MNLGVAPEFCKISSLTIRAFTMGNVIIFYFTISKSYFINYTIPFYNEQNLATKLIVALGYKLTQYLFIGGEF